MVTTTVHCAYCGSEDSVRNGRSPNGKQKYRWKACKRQSRENPTPHVYAEERREEILRAYARAKQFARERTNIWGDLDPFFYRGRICSLPHHFFQQFWTHELQ